LRVGGLSFGVAAEKTDKSDPEVHTFLKQP
jgi:hypothetical protein